MSIIIQYCFSRYWHDFKSQLLAVASTTQSLLTCSIHFNQPDNFSTIPINRHLYKRQVNCNAMSMESCKRRPFGSPGVARSGLKRPREGEDVGEFSFAHISSGEVSIKINICEIQERDPSN